MVLRLGMERPRQPKAHPNRSALEPTVHTGKWCRQSRELGKSLGSSIRKIRYYYLLSERALGFRADAKQVHWAIVEGTQRAPVLVAHDKASAPVNLDEAPALTWYSTRVRHIVETYKPYMATIRSAEPIARGSGKDGARRRLRLEGVLLQTIDSCGLKVTIGALAMISGKLGSQAKK